MRMTSIARLVDNSIGTRRFYTYSAINFAIMAVLLIVGGAAALTSRVVADGRRDLAIRMALGATLEHVTGIALAQVFWSIVIGITAGIIAESLSSAWLEQFAFITSARSPIVYLACGGTLLLAVMIGSYFPTRKLASLQLTPILNGP